MLFLPLLVRYFGFTHLYSKGGLVVELIYLGIYALAVYISLGWCLQKDFRLPRFARGLFVLSLIGLIRATVLFYQARGFFDG